MPLGQYHSSSSNSTKNDDEKDKDKEHTPVSSWWPPAWWPFSGNKHKNGGQDVKPQRPLLLLPGICGSILNVTLKGNPKETERVWVRFEDADSQFQKLWGKFNSTTNKVELFDDSLEVTIPQKDGDGGLYAIDELDPLWLGFTPSLLYYYHVMIDRLQNEHNFEPGSTLFGFGYDYRQSNRSHAEKLSDLIRSIQQQNEGKKIDLISHSMGGLVVLSLLAQYPDIFKNCIENWISIASPFGGAPGFVMNTLVNGASFVTGWEAYFFVQRETFLQMCIECPSVYEMLPQKWVGDDSDPNAVPNTNIWIKSGKGKAKLETCSLEQFKDLQGKVLAGNQVQVGDRLIDLPQNQACMQYAQETQNMWASVQLPSSCKFYNIYGIGYDTPLSPTYGTQDQPLSNFQDVKSAEAYFFSVDGDGTVPAVCAQNGNLPAVESKAFVGLHRGLLKQTAVFDQIVEWLGLQPDTNSQCTQISDRWVFV
eukprot:TRINITY_DN16576_c1_g5_i1.p1 TRINITY_DN16576_c1_g5~~TRINITY_DN16576_c1_g5_i1.p1  ORF type:complete len:478 (-),score=40.81 TRINITY_DN16576_c1_g5_i1:325-1758(-)